MDKTITTNYGKIVGEEQKDYVVYKGIPYAKPPIGNLRWKAPQTPDPWQGIYEAKNFSAKCPQDENHFGLYQKEFYNNLDFLRPSNEDCLYLNIWVPKTNTQKKPVAFWIHGGAFSGGYSSEIEFDGEAYCKKDIILVTVNYRLNVYGFLAHPWLSAENERGISGNYGILDQVAALKWVYENIGYFGGDSENITVFGQSAGSMSTQVLVSSKLTDHMIHKAILQSGITYKSKILFTPSLEEEERIGEKFVSYTGAKSLEELRKLSTKELDDARKRFIKDMWKAGNGIVFVPNIDGYVLKDSVSNLLEKGQIKDIPYMLGTVQEDLNVTKEQIASGDKGELFKDCKRWSFKLEELGREPAYIYYFAHHLPGDEAGAFHSAELWYTFGTLGRCWRPMKEHDYQLSEEMVTYWTNFMRYGSPADDKIKEWRKCSRMDPFIKEFNG